MLKINKLLLFICALLIANVSFSQIVAESPYSSYGLGDFFPQGQAQNIALGGTGIGIRNPLHVNTLNPASYSSIDTTAFILEFGLRDKYMTSSLGSASTDVNNASMSYLTIAFPIIKHRLYTSVGIRPITNINYSIVNNITTGIPKENHYDGGGGISSIYLGNSLMITKDFSLGFEIAYLYGLINKNQMSKFTDHTSTYINYNTTDSINVHDFSYNYGAQYSFDINTYKLNLGVTFANNNNLDSDRRLFTNSFYNSDSSKVVDTIQYVKTSGNILLPTKFGIGFSLNNENWLYAMDFSIQQWSQMTIFDENANLNNSSNLTFGVEYIPLVEEFRTRRNYFKKVRYRLGGHIQNTSILITNSNDKVKDIGVSLGMGMPVGTKNSSLNLALEIGQRGSFNNKLIKENYVILSINLSLHDSWFHRSKIE